MVRNRRPSPQQPKDVVSTSTKELPSPRRLDSPRRRVRRREATVPILQGRLVCSLLLVLSLPCLFYLSHSSMQHPAVMASDSQSSSLRRTTSTTTTSSDTVVPPSDDSQDNEPLWSNPYDIVHVIQTRFMQYQPHLQALGRARLELLKVITLASLEQQSSDDFLWIIRTDPDLDSALRNDLVALLEESPVRVVLVASNQNPEGFRGNECLVDATPENVWVGSLETMQAYHAAAQTRTVLETRLDADDALLLDFVAALQARAADTLTEHWRVWCIRSHMEWQYEALFPGQIGRGTLLGLQTPQCVTPGLTWGYTVNASRHGIGVSQHHKIHSSMPACSDTLTGPVLPADEDEEDEEYDDNTPNDDQVDEEEEEEETDAETDTDMETTEKDASADSQDSNATNITSKCLDRWAPSNSYPSALRARTPTSAGMDRVVTGLTDQASMRKHFEGSKWGDMQETLWKALPVLFGIDSAQVWDMRAHFQEHLADMLADAVVGLCTPGHSCKNTTKELLGRLLNETVVA